MTSPSTPTQPGELAPDCLLPGGARLFDLRGGPVVLAFAPDEWNPAHAYQSEIFARLLQEFSDGPASAEAAAEGWHALEAGGDVASRLGVGGHRALLLIDERGILRWKIEVGSGEQIHPGQVLAALESLRPAPDDGAASRGAELPAASSAGALSRRTFLAAALAAAAVLALPAPEAGAAPTARPNPRPVAGQVADSYDRSGTVPVTLKVNGQTRRLQVEPRVSLLDALREYLHLTGTKKGCDHGQCGACTVHLEGQSVLSCLSLAVMSQGKEVTTIEGIARGEELHPVQAAFIKHDAFQCGYCTPGQIMAATALIQDGKARTEAEIRESMSGNLCRCAAYPNIIAAVKEAQSA